MEHTPFKCRPSEPDTSIGLDGELASEWPDCSECGADAMVATVDGVALIGRPLTVLEALEYGLRCTECGELTDGFQIAVFHLRH